MCGIVQDVSGEALRIDVVRLHEYTRVDVQFLQCAQILVESLIDAAVMFLQGG